MKNSLEKTFAKFEKKKQAKPEKTPFNVIRLCAILGVGLGLIASLNLGVYIHKTQITEKRLERLDTLSQQRAGIVAEIVQKYITSIQESITAMVSKPAMISAVETNNQAALKSIQDAFIAQRNDVIATRIFSKGESRLDADDGLPIRFTELEMIRQAEKAKNVLPEAVKIENDWRVNLVAPIYSEGQNVSAVMLISLSLDELKKRVLQDKASLGKVSLFQKFKSSNPLQIFSVGQGNAGKTASEPIKNTYWKVNFQPSYALLENTKASALTIYVIIALTSIFLVAIFMYAGLRVGRYVSHRLNIEKNTGSGVKAATKVAVEKKSTNVPLDTDILDVDIADGDEELLGLDEVVAEKAGKVDEQEDILELEDLKSVPDVVFRAYDIRGIAKEQITTHLAQLIGQALGSEAIDIGQDTLIVARDARLSSPELTEFLIRGILSSGCNVLNIGTVPTPLMYFATATLKESQSGVMVTASHNAGEYNGFKIVMNGKTRSDEDIKSIRKRIIKKDLYEGNGEESRHEIIPDYIDTIFSDVALAGDISIVIDAGNGVTGVVAPKLFEELGCEVTPLFCDLDGSFPNHSPDPSIESNLQPLIDKVKETQSDLGVAFDGDGDRVIIVTSSGRIIWPDQLLMLFAKDIVSRNPGAGVVFDVKSTRHLVSCITSYGGRPIMWKTGHAPMKNKMLETGALLGGEYSGHIFIKDRWFGFDDGMYAAARLIEVLSLQGESLDMMFDEFPTSPSTPEIRLPIADEKKFDVIEKLASSGNFGDGRVTKIDGVRVDFSYGWGLVRASNTSANLTLRFEADDDAGLHKVKSIIAKELKNVDSNIQIDWNT
ncbi:phosphomannomutase/phosphoglucomutase [Agarilytica rhodophyticola]|uniref:phosphomannomutase/phosphoglucomutase n=1 Tax=Agarilytica rhodophyticola TaxID=1737490 RepID=UPI000B349EDF|nr:phosphomannomutase/phosphoglucomutase [Agarilytica rhodophyticola]